jgi:ComF family protein
MRIKTVFQTAINMFMPPTCQVCATTVPNGGNVLCFLCERELAKSPRVGKTRLLDSTPEMLSRIDIDVFAIWEYSPFIRTVIHRAKFDPSRKLLSFLGDRLKNELQAHNNIQSSATLNNSFYDIIVPIPPSESHARKRLLNQSLVLSQRVHHAISISLLERSTASLPQSALSATQRRNNLRKHIAVKKDQRRSISGKRVLLIDDVVATGSSLRVASEILYAHGASKVSCAVLALAPATT